MKLLQDSKKRAATASRLEKARVPYSPRKLLHAFNFFRWHVVAGLLVPVVAAGIFVACDTGANVAYIDALFMCTSALTLTGLTVTLLADLSFGQQFILYLLLQFGSIQSVSLITLLVRRATFNKQFSDPPVYFPSSSDRRTRAQDLEAAEEVLNAHQGENATDSSSSGDDQQTATGSTAHDEQEHQSQDREKAPSQGVKRSGTVNAAGRGGFPNPVVAIFSTGNQQIRKRYRSNADAPISQYTAGKTSEPNVEGSENKTAKQPQSEQRKKELEPRFGRNSNVQGIINEEQHAMLARLEISAMTFLIYTVLLYWLGIQLLAGIMWAPYFSSGRFSSSFSEDAAVSKTWFSVFQSASFLNNCGLTLVDTSLTTFQTCYIMLVPAFFMMVAGNLGFPIGIRAVLWSYNSLLKPGHHHKQLTNFILEHPRRIFFYLFPPYETIALLFVIAVLTSIDWVFFYVLDIGYREQGVFAIVPAGARVINGLVQSAAVRSAGFYVVNQYNVAPALNVLYLFMMIFAIYPIAMAIRATNVYEEKSLGVAESDETNSNSGLQHLKQEEGFISLHLRDQLAYDVWFTIFAVFLVCIVERASLEDSAISSFGTFSIFSVIFECSSAYSNAGLSIGSPSSNTSTSGSFRKISKLIICATMIRGRTRGLPVLVDRAVMTPRQLEEHGDSPSKGMQSEEPAKEAQQQS